MDPNYTVDEMNDLLARCKIPEVAARGAQFFCTCGDTKCPYNPGNPKNAAEGRGCTGCIVKNLRMGEVPSCIFKTVGDTAGWEDYSIQGFVDFCARHGITAAE